MTLEQRQHLRRDALKTGTLFFAENRQCADCLIWNVTLSGAMLEVENDATIARTGRLISETLFVDRAYNVVWREGSKIGVAFDD